MRLFSKYSPVITLALLCAATSSWPAGPITIQGRVTDSTGRAVSGAAVQLSDKAGKLRYAALSDMSGRYRMAAVAPSAAPLRATVSRAGFRPTAVADILSGRQLVNLAPAVIARNFVLAAAEVVPAGPTVDANHAEYYYQQALLRLGEGKKKEAVDLLKLYVQNGTNNNQLARSLQLIVENEGQN